MKRIEAFDGIRAYAVFLVFLVHYATLISPFINSNSSILSVANFFHRVGNIGVDLFFMLSGYLIYSLLVKKKYSFKEYFYRRVKRIYPTFIFVLFLYIFLCFLFPEENKLPATTFHENVVYILSNILLLPGVFNIKPLVTVSWSLSYEFLFYLVAPLIVYVFGIADSNSRSRRNKICFIFLVFLLLIEFFAPQFRRFLMFGGGMLLWETKEYLSGKVIDYFGFFFLISSPLIFWLLQIYGLFSQISLLVSFYVILLASRQDDGVTSTLLKIKPIRYFGEISYSYFLIHGLVLKAIFWAFKKFEILIMPPVLFWILMPASFILTVLAGYTLYQFVERPLSLGEQKGSVLHS